MSMTAISDRPRQQHVPPLPPAQPAEPQSTEPQSTEPRFASPSPVAVEAAPAVTLTLEVAITGDRLPVAALRMLKAIRELVAELGDDAVRVTGPTGITERINPTEDHPTEDHPGGIFDDGGHLGSGREHHDHTGGDSAGGTGGGVLVRGERHARHAQAAGASATGDGVLYVYPDSRTAVRDGTALRLTRLEFDLLLFLCEQPDRAFRRAELLRDVWGYAEASIRTVDVHIRRLRAKTGAHRPLVTTVHGVGYRLDRRALVSVVRAA